MSATAELAASNLSDAPAPVIARVRRSRRRRAVRRTSVVLVLVSLVLGAIAVTLMFGQRFVPAADVLRVIAGEQVPGASFVVGELRLPRAIMALVAGLSFGLAGSAFQTLLRNPLASPDIVGITSSASAAAAFAIITLGLSGFAVSAMAVTAGVVTSLAIYLLAYRGGVAGTRLILIGIGVAAMMQSVIAAQLDKATGSEAVSAIRWLTGSLNNSRWQDVNLAGIALLVLAPIILWQASRLETSRLGDDTAAALGVRVEWTKLIVIVCSVGLVSFATAATGPIAFVAFLSGPIVARLVGAGSSLLLPAALVGALMVLGADFAGQHAFDTRLPAGVVTGALGAPYLLYLIARVNRVGGSQ
ncbi:MAG: iron chelate uptake ABC transporter family permease subunit [Nocardioidaceae bacterium]|nr:iron chelate uptake ABC transporter family permease subunit [Nocardioidaceae bacterium]